jgi:hypothetical protein
MEAKVRAAQVTQSHSAGSTRMSLEQRDARDQHAGMSQEIEEQQKTRYEYRYLAT